MEQLSQFDASDSQDSDGTPPGTMEEALQRMSGGDLSSMNGISTNTALKIIAEIRINMSRWQTVKQFTSWEGCAQDRKSAAVRF